MDKLDKFAFTVLLGYFTHQIPLVLMICVGSFFVLLDVLSAWDLARRLQNEGKSTGKFKSTNAKRTIPTMVWFWLGVIAAHMLEKYVLIMLDQLYLANWFTGAFCLLQAISICENVSSANDKPWARAMQKILADKASRHFDVEVDLNDFKCNKDEDK